MGGVSIFSGWTTHSLGGCILSISTKQKKKQQQQKEEALGDVQRSLSWV